jgi:hypothetical protein
MSGRLYPLILRLSSLRRSSFGFRPKKLPPPTPDRREGRLFPPEQSSKTSRLLNELPADRNKFYVKNSHGRMRQEKNELATHSDLIRHSSFVLRHFPCVSGVRDSIA